MEPVSEIEKSSSLGQTERLVSRDEEMSVKLHSQRVGLVSQGTRAAHQLRRYTPFPALPPLGPLEQSGRSP